MPNHRLVLAFRALALVVLLVAPSAKSEVEAWDQAKVVGFAKDLATATDALHDTFQKQLPPSLGSMHSHAYYRLKQWVRLLQLEARQLATSVEQGEGREQTLASYENLMQLARSARDDARKAFIGQDVGDRAAAVRGVLNRLGPYYDPDFQTLAPNPNIEPGATR